MVLFADEYNIFIIILKLRLSTIIALRVEKNPLNEISGLLNFCTKLKQNKEKSNKINECENIIQITKTFLSLVHN